MKKKTITAPIDLKDPSQRYLLHCADAVNEFYMRNWSRSRYKSRNGKLVNVTRMRRNKTSDQRALNQYRSILSDTHRKIVALQLVKEKSQQIYERTVRELVNKRVAADFMERFLLAYDTLIAQSLFPPYLKMTEQKCRIIWKNVSEEATRAYTKDLEEACEYKYQCSVFRKLLDDLMAEDRELKTIYIKDLPSNVGCNGDRFMQSAVVKGSNIRKPYRNSGPKRK
jgi:hypothetical protein